MDDERDYTNYWLIGIIVTGLWMLAFVFAFFFSTNGLGSEIGTFGDSFGSINALFSGLALAGVVIALIIQSKEYGLAKDDRKDGIEAQRILGRQQYVSSLTSSIATLTELNRERKISRELARQDPNYMRMVVDQNRMRTLVIAVIKSLHEHDPSRNQPIELDLDNERTRRRNFLSGVADSLVDLAEECAKQIVLISIRIENEDTDAFQNASHSIKHMATSLSQNALIGKALKEEVPGYFNRLVELSQQPANRILDSYRQNGDFDESKALNFLYLLYEETIESTAILSGVFFDSGNRERVTEGTNNKIHGSVASQ